MFLFRWLFKIVFKLLIFVIIWVIFLMVLFNWPVKTSNESMHFFVSFSDIFAEKIGLDWKKVYLAVLEDLKPEKIRVAAYWKEIEKEPEKYDFSRLDWQLEEARRQGIKIILAFGIKAPRWPECFIPEFYLQNKEVREQALLKYEKILVERYKFFKNIESWQVENEPFLSFGDCIAGAMDSPLVDKEIALVRAIDDRPVIITDSGELSYWYEAAKRGDIFGTTLYRTVYKEPFGYIKYPLGPNFFRLKALFINLFASQENIIISELQAEPWGGKPIDQMSVEEQYESMNPEIFKEIIQYAKKTNFSESYLWGVEWWYWLKDKHHEEEMWQMAKETIKTK